MTPRHWQRAPAARWKRLGRSQRAATAKSADINTAIDKALAEVGPRAATAAAQANERVAKAHEACTRVCNAWRSTKSNTARSGPRPRRCETRPWPTSWTGRQDRAGNAPSGHADEHGQQRRQDTAVATNAILEASFARATGALKDFDKAYSPQVLEALDKNDGPPPRHHAQGPDRPHGSQAHGFTGRYIEAGPVHRTPDPRMRLDRAYPRCPAVRQRRGQHDQPAGHHVATSPTSSSIRASGASIPSWRTVSFTRSRDGLQAHAAYRVFGATTFEKLGSARRDQARRAGRDGLCQPRRTVRQDAHDQLRGHPQRRPRGLELRSPGPGPRSRPRLAGRVLLRWSCRGRISSATPCTYAASGKDGKGQMINVEQVHRGRFVHRPERLEPDRGPQPVPPGLPPAGRPGRQADGLRPAVDLRPAGPGNGRREQP